MSATLENPSVRRRCAGAFARSDAGSRPSTRPSARSACRRARSRSPCSERTSSQPTWGCEASAGSSRGCRASISSRVAPRLVHQVHEPEAARRKHDDVLSGDVVLPALLLHGAAGRLAERCPDRAVVLVAARERSDVGALQRLSDQVVEPLAVALLERRNSCLPVVGEHDDLVRSRCIPAGSRDPAELVIELVERLQRVGPLEPRVVGDLVVARERRVDGGPPAHDVRDHGLDDQVAHDDAHRGPEERVDASRCPRQGTSRRFARSAALHLRITPPEEHEHARDVETVREERPVARIGPLLRLDPAHGEDQARPARTAVAAARAAVEQQALVGRVTPFQPAQSAGAEHVITVAVSSRPSGRRGCPGSTRAGCRPGLRRSARRGRSPSP